MSKTCIGKKLEESPFSLVSVFSGFVIVLVSLAYMFIGWEVEGFIVRWTIIGLVMYIVPVFYAGWECKNENN